VCGKVQPAMQADYFAMFGLPPKLDLDGQALEKQFYRYSRKLHPDVHARASEQEQEWSLAQASLLNDAYRTLKNPLDRTKYLLKLEGVQFEEDRGTNPDKNPSKNPSGVPADLLEEVFELNMQLEELRQNQKMGEDDPQLRKDLEAAKNQFAGQLSTLDEQVRSRWAAWDEAWEQNDEAGKTAAKDAMTALLQRRSYLQNLVRDVEQTLGGL
jgi:molecular chaperone HscB